MESQDRRNRKGFTLIELLVVITIIAILMSVLIPVIFNAIEEADKADTSQFVKRLGNSILAYKDKTGKFPSDYDSEGPNGLAASDNPYGEIKESYLYSLQNYETSIIKNGSEEIWVTNFITGARTRKSDLSTSNSHFLRSDEMMDPNGTLVGVKAMDVWGNAIEYRRMPLNLADFKIRFKQDATINDYNKFVSDRKFHLWSPGPDAQGKPPSDYLNDQKYRESLNPKAGTANSDYYSGGYSTDVNGGVLTTIGNWK